MNVICYIWLCFHSLNTDWIIDKKVFSCALSWLMPQLQICLYSFLATHTTFVSLILSRRKCKAKVCVIEFCPPRALLWRENILEIKSFAGGEVGNKKKREQQKTHQSYLTYCRRQHIAEELNGDEMSCMYLRYQA